MNQNSRPPDHFEFRRLAGGVHNDTRSRTAGTCSERTRDTPPTLTISNLLRRQRRRRGAEPVVPSACRWPAEPAEDGRGTAATRRTASSRTTAVSRRRCSDRKKMKLKRTDDKVNCCCNCGCQRDDDDDDDNNERRHQTMLNQREISAAQVNSCFCTSAL